MAKGVNKIMGSNEMDNLILSENDEQETDRLLSEHLLQLSFHERNNVNEEIHGVRDRFPEWKEHPESVELSLINLDCEVQSILLKNSNKNSGLCLDHIPMNRELRLTFLRCELFDAKKAANRLVTYIRLVRERCACGGGITGCACGSIGEQGSDGRIRSKWFTKEEYSALKKGTIQLMPFRDRSGRRVMVFLTACFQISLLTRLKIILYLISGAAEDVESQKRGIVVMVWPGRLESSSVSDSGFHLSIHGRQKAIEVQMAFPLRLVCMHFGYASSPLLKLARIFLVAIMEHQSRVRFNSITGTKTEINYKIMGYGIHPVMLPVANNETIKIRNHVQWLEARKCIERNPYGTLKTTSTGGAIVECPGVNDVLFNRGKSCQYHPGNVTFRGLLESKKRQHLNANQTMKKEIASEIMEEVEIRSGRFLHWDKPGWWVEFEDRTEIRHKIATSLRDFNKQSRATENRQNNHSSTNVFLKRKRSSPDSSDSSSDCSCPRLMCD